MDAWSKVVCLFSQQNHHFQTVEEQKQKQEQSVSITNISRDPRAWCFILYQFFFAMQIQNINMPGDHFSISNCVSFQVDIQCVLYVSVIFSFRNYSYLTLLVSFDHRLVINMYIMKSKSFLYQVCNECVFG